MNILMLETMIKVDIDGQTLELLRGDQVICRYIVSTAKNGPGERFGSECTPRGWHTIRAKIGADCPLNTVFTGRRFKGEIYSPEMAGKFPHRDWILTRILWLSGLETSKNRLGNVDTMRRYIYIHGCPDQDIIGVPNSHGCIKLSNRDVIDLFDRVTVGTRVLIKE